MSDIENQVKEIWRDIKTNFHYALYLYEAWRGFNEDDKIDASSKKNKTQCLLRLIEIIDGNRGLFLKDEARKEVFDRVMYGFL